MTHPILDSYGAWRRGQSGSKATGERLFASLMEQDDRLVRAGFPPMTDWWKDTLERFYKSGKRKLVGRIGRKGHKSTNGCRVACNEILSGDHLLRPGDIGLYMFTSENTFEAKGRLFMMKAILDALGVGYEPLDRDTRIIGTALTFGVRAARIGAVSGPVVIGFIGDEVAKWRDEETGANPATEVLRSVRPAMVTQKNAHEFLFSSPWSTLDAHHEAFSEGDTDDQLVAYAPTWIANPTVTEEDTKRLEKDEPTRLREYGAIPMGAGESGMFDHGAIDAAALRGKDLTMPLVAAPGTVVTAGGDLAFERDCASLAIAHRVGAWNDDASRYTIADLLQKRPRPSEPLMPGEVIEEFAAKLKWHHCGWMMADGHYRMSAVEHLQKHHLTFADAPEGQRGKAESYVRLRVVLHGGRLTIPGNADIVKQLKEVTSKPTAGGGLSISSPHKSGGGHGDMVSSVVLAVWQPNGYEVPAGLPTVGTPEHAAMVEQAMFDQAKKRQKVANRAKGSEWWQKR